MSLRKPNTLRKCLQPQMPGTFNVSLEKDFMFCFHIHFSDSFASVS